MMRLKMHFFGSHSPATKAEIDELCREAGAFAAHRSFCSSKPQAVRASIARRI